MALSYQLPGYGSYSRSAWPFACELPISEGQRGRVRCLIRIGADVCSRVACTLCEFDMCSSSPEYISSNPLGKKKTNLIIVFFENHGGGIRGGDGVVSRRSDFWSKTP